MEDGVLKDRVKQMIVECARLKIPAAELGDEVVLFGPEGLGLDSIDLLELVVGLERTFGVTIQDGETGRRVLRTVNSIVQSVKESGKV